MPIVYGGSGYSPKPPKPQPKQEDSALRKWWVNYTQGLKATGYPHGYKGGGKYTPENLSLKPLKAKPVYYSANNPYYKNLYAKYAENPELMKTPTYQYQKQPTAYYAQSNPYYHKYATNPELKYTDRYRNKTHYTLKTRTPGIVSGYPPPEGYTDLPGAGYAGGAGAYGSFGGSGYGRGGYRRNGYGGGGGGNGFGGYVGSPDYGAQSRQPMLTPIQRWIQNMIFWRFE
jgi:hypothetical protein